MRGRSRRYALVDTSIHMHHWCYRWDRWILVDDFNGELESLEARRVVHEKNEAVYEEDIAFLKYDVQVKDISIKDLKNQLEETLKEKDDLKLKLENQINNESELVYSVFNSRESDVDNSPVNDRFKIGEGFHAVPPPYTGNYMPLRPDLSFDGLDDSVYKTKGTGHREVRPIWNNTQRINHQNKFVPNAVLTRSGRIPVSTTKQVSKEKVNTVRVNGVNTAGQTAVSTVKGNGVTAVKASAGCVWRPKMTDLNNGSKDNSGSWISKRGNPQQALKYKGMFDSGCSRHMTGNKALLTDYQDIDGGFVAFGGSTRGGKITGIGKIRTNKIDFEDVFFVKELKFNLFSVSQMCDKKNSVLFTETECLVLSPDFKLIDESQVLLRVPRQNNMYSFDLKNVVPSGDLTCLFAKATIDESKLWHRRLGHVNFKTMNKLVKGNLVRGLPSKTFENDHTCVACQKGKQHKASCKTKLVSSISQPLQMLHMDLFGPTSVRSINHKTYCLVVTDDFSREMDEFCGQKGIKREYSVARTPQQNGVAERKNRTLIEAARTMLADSLLPTVFWAEAVNTACYVLNRVLVTKPHNKTPYELIIGRAPSISFMRPFGCPVTILNTLYPLGKFDGKAEEGFLVGYSVNSKAFRVFNTETKKVKENLHVNFLENKPNVAGQGPNWLFDIDSLTNSMNYQPVSAGNQTNKNAGPQETNGNTGLKKNVDAGQTEEENVSTQQYIMFPLWSSISSNYKSSDDKAKDDTVDDDACKKMYKNQQEKITRASSTNNFNTISTLVNTANASRTFSPVGPSSGPSFVPFGGSFSIDVANLPHDPLMPELEDTVEIQSTGIFGNAYDDHDLETLNTPYADQTIQTRGMTKKNSREHAMISYIQKQRSTNHKDFQNCLFACFLSQHEPTKISQALDDESWVEAMQEELLQFKIQKVWTLVDLPSGKKAIGTKWVYRNKKDERGIVVEAIRLFFAFASFMNFVVYQMDVKSSFLYGTIEEEVYVCQPPSFVDPEFPEKVYKVEKALYGLHQAPRACKIVTFSKLEEHSGSKLGDPFPNIFLESGKSLMQCQIDAWEKLGELEKTDFYTVDVDGDDTCGLCDEGGNLICCDGCPSTLSPKQLRYRDHESCRPELDYQKLHCLGPILHDNSFLILADEGEYPLIEPLLLYGHGRDGTGGLSSGLISGTLHLTDYANVTL
ncbi:putative ribonuclease H-like domain-containing protein [Tanacetum coccineum]